MITCEFEDGGAAKLRHCTVDVLLLNGDKILLCKRAAHMTTEAGKWCLTGGYMDRDETIAEGAAREVLEESGWKIRDLTLLTIRDDPQRPKDKDRQNIVFVLFGQADTEVGAPDDESEEVRWFDLTDLPPRDQMAFDHADSIELYLSYKAEDLTLPVFTTTVA